MDYYSQVLNIRTEAISKLKNEIEEGMKIKLYDLDANEDYLCDEEFVELPTEYVYGKYDYGVLYYLHTVYMENETVYVKGIETSEMDEYDFNLNELFSDNLAQVVDMALPLIEDEKVEWEKTQKRCRD
jgi:hypothetical protein